MDVSIDQLTTDELDELTQRLTGEGVTLLVGTALDFAGVTRAKGVPLRRLGTFHKAGMGASPSWLVMCVDNHIALTSAIGVEGDLRLRLDASKVRRIDAGLAWGPTGYYNQDGTASEHCPRGRLAHTVAAAQEQGLSVVMGTEIEFTVSPVSGERIPDSWICFGMRPLVRHQEFVIDLTDTLEAAGVGTEQIHAEYGRDQFEVSLAPSSPMQMADMSILTRILITITAARYNLAVSFSPMPWIGGTGNGAHMHLSLYRGGNPLFAGGDGPHGITDEGGSAIAGILQAMPELLGVYAGSAISAQRLTPGSWSGASACWGLENREAAVRYLAATQGNPQGANVELKIVDPSANVYLAATALLGSALHGIKNKLPLPAEMSSDPADDPRHADLLLPADQPAVLDALAGSALAAEILSPQVVEGVLAVRRHEETQFVDASAEHIADALRFAWS